MAITVPSGARKTFEKVLGAMGGEDYSYYLFDCSSLNNFKVSLVHQYIGEPNRQNRTWMDHVGKHLIDRHL